MESPRKVVVGEEAGDGGESSESVVLQCSASGGVEQGEEVAMARGEGHRGGRQQLPYIDRYGSLTVALEAYCDGVKLKAAGEEMVTRENVCVGAEDGGSESKVVVSVRGVDRSLGGRKITVTPRMASFQTEGGYWRGDARRRCRARKSYMHGPFGVGASVVVDRTAVKRKHEEVKQCSPVLFEAEDNESDDSASSSDSDGSDSDSEEWKRRDTSNKRRRGGEDVKGSDESMQLSSILRKKPSSGSPSSMAQESIGLQDEEETADYDDELKEMQQLLELQLQAAEKREAGMKHRMEKMMDVLSQHMGHAEKRVGNLEGGTQPQDQVLERINVKLEKVMEGFSTLNENLALLSACLSKNLESQ